MKSDTIAAISTGMTAAGISIIRISGPEAIPAADRLFSGRAALSGVPSHTIHHGYVEKDGISYDEVLVSVMRMPHTYTGEDVVEINCHGGLFVAEKILSLVLSEGVRLAEPGEFTKRAFLNGRMDLSKAESVISVISSGNEFALSAGVSGLKGRISEKIRAVRSEILDEISRIEAALDDPEHYDLEGYGAELAFSLQKIDVSLREILKASENGSLFREGIRTVIAGMPNAGKSSLLNLLSGFEKSIVTDIPGTTRDVIEETVRLGPFTLILMDTAGIRSSDDPVEKIGVERAKAALSQADLVLYLVDASLGKQETDRETLKTLDPEKTLLLYNKSDKLPENAGKEAFSDGILFSCLKEDSGSVLEDAVKKLLFDGRIHWNDEVILTSRRQIALLKDAIAGISEVQNGIEAGVSEEFLSGDLLSVYTSLGQIIGEAVTDDVTDRIFEKFCMGK